MQLPEITLEPPDKGGMASKGNLIYHVLEDESEATQKQTESRNELPELNS